MRKNDLVDRTFRFSNDIIKFVELLPTNRATRVISYQILKSATSVGANYRATQKARSDKEFISKLNIVQEEADETLFWLQLIKEQKWIDNSILDILIKEADELVAIFTSSLIKMNKKMN